MYTLAVLVSIALCVGSAPIASSQVNDDGVIVLASFGADDKTQWKALNDPVMGGQSKSVYKRDAANKVGLWSGEVKIVPSLKAPGFCNLETTKEIFSRFNDVSSTTHMMLKVKTTTPEYQGFKMSFAANTINPQFASFKANFNITGSDWTVVSIPWDSFSNDWSSFTGDCSTKDPTGKQHICCSKEHPEVCPTVKDLAKIQALGMWTEGSAGAFNVEIMWIGAGNGSTTTAAVASSSVQATQDHTMTCSGKVQKPLRFNISGKLASKYIPFPSLPFETVATAVCCDSSFAMYAEPLDFFALPEIDMFAKLTNDSFTFYDSVCGIPLFKGPVNRTFAEFKAETASHHWPSFREEEVVKGNVLTSATGKVTSKCGTHLGDNLPDSLGDRYCIDLSCISGTEKK